MCMYIHAYIYIFICRYIHTHAYAYLWRGFQGQSAFCRLIHWLIYSIHAGMHALHTYATHWSILFCTYLLHRDTCSSTSFEALKCPKNMTLSETMCLTDCMRWFKYLWCVWQLLTCWIESLFHWLQLFGPFAQPLHFFVHPFARKKVNHGWWTDVSMSRARTNSFGWNMLRKSAVFVTSILLKWFEYPPGN